MEKRHLLNFLNAFFGFSLRKTILVLSLMVSLSLMEGVSLLMLIPLLKLVGLDVQQGVLGRISEFVSSLFATVGIQPTLLAVLGFYVLIIVIHSLLKRWENSVSLTLQYEFVVHLRQRLYTAISNTKWLYFVRNRASDFTHALTIEMERVGAATYYLLTLVVTGIVAIVYILFAIKLSPLITGLVFLCGGILLLLMKGKTRVAEETGEGLSDAMSNLYAAVTEHLGGMKIAKSYGAEGRHAEVFGRLTEQVRHLYTHAVRNQAEVNYWFNIGSVLILSLILYVSIEALSLPTPGVLLLLYLFARLMPKFSSIQQNFQSLMNMLPSFTRIMEMQKRCEAEAEPKIDKTLKFDLRDGIRFDSVCFSYDGQGNSPVIINLDVTLKAGQTTAIVGPSGAGKSTIADLVMGLIVPNQGQIFLGGMKLTAEQTKAWRKQIGYVPQDTFLFHDTLRANLLWAKPDASEDEMNQALTFAAAEFVSGLPNGTQTNLGDRGVLISGGERQRIALARALLRKPSLLILDEATSSLDSENEKRIQNAIENLHGRMTILLISHRLSTIKGADIIHLIEEGRLVESGTWSELVSKNGRFKDLCDAQGINPANLSDG